MSDLTMIPLVVQARRLARRPPAALLPLVAISALCAVVVHRRRLRGSSSPSSSGGGCAVSLGKYDGRVYDHRRRHRGDAKSSSPSSSSSASVSAPRFFGTTDNECLVESPWMRVARHSVRLLSPRRDDDEGDDKGDDEGAATVVDDWLWIDYHDRINVLVEAPPPPNRLGREGGGTRTNTREFVVLEQVKYALNTPSLAVVGGIVGRHEDESVAARREVFEELSIECDTWTALGGPEGFRTDVNRGMGWVSWWSPLSSLAISPPSPPPPPNFRHLSLSLLSLSPSTTKVHPFLATDCAYVADGPGDGDGDGDDGGGNAAAVGGRDVEEQSVRRMTLSEVREAVVRGMFVEVQWSNTVALGILHLTTPPPSDGRWEEEEDD
jgi:8-oxo-dGTP pyrophosphatase MutT (NUDIX family)